MCNLGSLSSYWIFLGSENLKSQKEAGFAMLKSIEDVPRSVYPKFRNRKRLWLVND
jgi:hypothetical protein